nr:sulfurase [Dehalococcoidia bacterium]
MASLHPRTRHAPSLPPAEAVAGRVEAIFTAPEAGAPMEQQGTVVVAPGVGIVGDRYALGTGTWSDPRWPDQELTLFEAEVADALGLEPYVPRRNIVLRGVSLYGLIGVRFRLGEAH